MKQESAIEWFKEQIGNYYAEDAYRDMENATMYMWFEQAKEIENKQISELKKQISDLTQQISDLKKKIQ